ncbi:MAG TPA: hypothetical protein VKE41_22055, partial [Roseiflexaceae bacterium]|nr:hypothetical protein [Roseiflexaceae bacterium]
MRRISPALVVLMIAVLLAGALPGAPALARMPVASASQPMPSSGDGSKHQPFASAQGSPILVPNPHLPSLLVDIAIAPDPIAVGETGVLT